MSNLFKVDVEQELISEYLEQLEATLQNIESHIIGLENDVFDINNLQAVRDLFHGLWVSSSKLSLTPLSESLDDTLKTIEMLLIWRQFPQHMGELLLLLMDRILYLAREVERSLVIDLRATQNILVSLQHILLSDNPNECATAIDSALKVMTVNTGLDTVEPDPDSGFDVELFGDEDDLQEIPSVSRVEDAGDIEIFEVFVPKATINPLLFAKDTVASMKQDQSFSLLADISDQGASHANSHTQFLIEIGLAVNYMAGGRIDVEGLAKGICLHDIALSVLPHVLNKTEKLSDEEFQLIKQHPIRGASLAQSLQVHEDGLNAIRHHHERMDGNGYPYNLKGAQISDAGKLTAIIDSFHAMVDKRPHKMFTRSFLRAVAELNACVDSHYDKFWIKQFNIFMKQHWLPYQKLRLQEV